MKRIIVTPLRYVRQQLSHYRDGHVPNKTRDRRGAFNIELFTQRVPEYYSAGLLDLALFQVLVYMLLACVYFFLKATKKYIVICSQAEGF